MSTPSRRVPLAPRLIVLAGAVLAAVPVFLTVDPAAGAGLHLGGGLAALAGLVWFLLEMRRIRRPRP